MGDERRRLGPGSVIGVGAGVVAAAAMVSLRLLSRSDLRRSGLPDREALRAASVVNDPVGAIHHRVTGIDGAHLHAVEAGPSDPDSPTVVLLHGVTLGWEIWHLIISALMTDHRVIAIDWRGHGSSTAGTQGYGLDLLASDLAAVLDALDVRSAVVVGHSMGGMALMRCWGEHRDVMLRRAGALVFLSTAAFDVVDGRGPAFVDHVFRRLARRPRLARNASRVPPGDLGWAAVRYTFGHEPPAAAVELARRLTVRMDPTATGMSFSSIVDHDARAWLPTVTLPTVAMVGSHDRLTPPAKAREIAALVPGAELVVVDRPGHLVMLEQPEALVEVIRRRVPRPGSSTMPR